MAQCAHCSASISYRDFCRGHYFLRKNFLSEEKPWVCKKCGKENIQTDRSRLAEEGITGLFAVVIVALSYAGSVLHWDKKTLGVTFVLPFVLFCLCFPFVWNTYFRKDEGVDE